MNAYNVVIIDDEHDAGILLNNLLSDYPGLLVQGVYTSSVKALDFVIAEQVPLVFADIEMPEISGIDFLKKINRYSPETKVVFVSAYDNYALEAIQNDAFDFLCKPVGREDLRRVVHKFMAWQNQHKENELAKGEKLLIKTSEGHHYLSVESVIFLEADSNYTNLVLCDGKKLLSSMTLGKIHDKFPKDTFARISRKHVINKKYLTFVNFQKQFCLLSFDGREYKLEISSKVKDIKEVLG